MTPSCLESPIDGAENFLGTDEIFQVCQDHIGRECNDYFLKFHLQRSRLKKCIFPGNICYNGTDAFEISQSDITAHTVGINSKSRVSMSRRLTCSPVHLDSFLLVNTGLKPHVNISVLDMDAAGYLLRNEKEQMRLNMLLNTMNGPNSLSHEPSGKLNDQVSAPYDVFVLPHIDAKDIGTHTVWGNITWDHIHPDLRVEAGMPFLMVYRAGRSVHAVQIDDPLFAAHEADCRTARLDDITKKPGYCPNHEATALGCIEQFQYCVPESGFCTSWGFR
ncbi:hypothetical protein HYALB_00000936 [Hymenoscyphus albidus]|uniref:Uncharacterized protein n=1 Tax=Hymenoscyphus albidus TaxID=595503 RepID=A0A9N9L9E3_9HELO|nr:hypothetical protein HYALB_00000936 [Hymenoscyphus albidus]